MCGIIGYVTLKPRASLSKFLGEGLIVDSLRGMCGAGIYGWDDINKEGRVWKRALTGYDFVNTHQFDQYKTDVAKLHIAIGHNRASTVGAAKDKNCHPFVFDHISLVHNGTLRNHMSLFKYEEFRHDVDSAYAARAISTMGAKQALEKIEGAFVFVWHDAKANTFNIARNGMRDIWYITDKEGENLYYASEYEMLNWLLERNNFTTVGKFRSPAEFTLCSWEIGKPLHKPKITPFEEYQPPKYPTYHDGWRGSRPRNRDEEDLAALGIEQYEMLDVEECSFEAYSAHTTKGRLYGKASVTIGDKKELHEFRYHGCEASEYEQIKNGASASVQACSVWYENSAPIITCRFLKLTPAKEGATLPNEIEMFPGPDGRYFDLKAFSELVDSGCCYCSSPIFAEDAKNITWLAIGTANEPLCPACAASPDIVAELTNYRHSLAGGYWD